MPSARNMKQLNEMLLKEVNKAMRVVSKKAEADLYEATGWFYTQQSPLQEEGEGYQRTGALGDTPKTTSNTVTKRTTGGEVTFNAYLDKNHIYSTGKNPPMIDVLNLANGDDPNNPNFNHNYSTTVGWLRDTNGNEQFWERAENNIEKDMNETLRVYFN